MRPVYLLIIIVFGLLVALNGCSTHNRFVEGDETVATAWADVEAQYQRRADLIPNLVSTVKGAADFEQETLTAVTQARSRATQVTIDPSKVTPEQLAEFQSAQGELSQALGRLLMVSENYPQLRATEAFKDLQQQLESTENRITVHRQKFNAAVRGYNVMVRKFPSNFWAGLFGFERKPMFEAKEGSDEAPEVNFD